MFFGGVAPVALLIAFVTPQFYTAVGFLMFGSAALGGLDVYARGRVHGESQSLAT